jgi:4-hydroxybenzoate polyprenyltransferase
MSNFIHTFLVDSYATKKQVPLYKIFLSLFSIVLIRIFLENLLGHADNDNFYSLQAIFLHGTLYFLSIFLSLTLLVYLLVQNSIREILRIVNNIFLLILLVPIIDLTFNHSKELAYVTIPLDNIISTFFAILNPLGDDIISIGQRVVSLIILILLSLFIYNKTKSQLKSFAMLILGYCILFFYAIIPSLIVAIGKYTSSITNNDPTNAYFSLLNQSWLSNYADKTSILDKVFFQINLTHDINMAHIFFIFVIAQSLLLLSIIKPNLIYQLKYNLRPTRIIYWSIIAIIGIILNQKFSGTINLYNPINILSLIVYFITLTLNIWLAVCINDNEDIEIDKISNKTRPLATGKISVREWNILQITLIVFFLFGIASMNRSVAILFLVAQAAYYLYSVQPLRLKRHFISSSIVSGFASVVIVMSGFFLVSTNQNIHAFSLKTALIIGIIYALLSNIKDIKDFHGDSQENIKTIPVLFGPRKARYVIATLYSSIILVLPTILHIQSALIVSIPIAIFIYYLFMQKVFMERYILFTFFLYMLIIYLWLN